YTNFNSMTRLPLPASCCFTSIFTNFKLSMTRTALTSQAAVFTSICCFTSIYTNFNSMTRLPLPARCCFTSIYTNFNSMTRLPLPASCCFTSMSNFSQSRAATYCSFTNFNSMTRLPLPASCCFTSIQSCYLLISYRAVPISTHHPPPLQEYYIGNSEASLLIPDFVDNVRPVIENTNAQILVLETALCTKASEYNADSSPLPQIRFGSEFYQESDALMIYTSGTTGNPKGVVVSHSNIHAQVSCLTEAWGWSENDSILHVLPLHHIHGIVNVLLCSLTCGARCVMLPKFDAATVWNHLLAENIPKTAEVNVFMAVPTVYVKLLEEYDKIIAKDPGAQERIYKICSEKIRLMVSGSAPLPVPLFKRWEQVTGHKLLERFGMSETGMVLSNPLHGKRKPGFVGNPLPGVEVQIAKKDKNNKYEVLVYGSADKGTTVLSNETTAGDLLVKGPNVFKGYWKMPEATKKEFTEDGWFKTGDTAQYVEGAYKIQGRTSVDIIKTGGYKVSALEIETHLLGHPDILDCAVVGLPDPTWGQKVAVVMVTRGGRNMTLLQLREFGRVPSKNCLSTHETCCAKRPSTLNFNLSFFWFPS
ncbi:hypothetical protein L9F63_019160, partial [Diploptera punctata]